MNLSTLSTLVHPPAESVRPPHPPLGVDRRADMDMERWHPIPGHEGYEISDHGNVRGLDRTIVRANGVRYSAKARIRRISVDRRNGLRYVKLATGKRGRYHTVYIRRLVADVFGETTPANINPPPANSTRPCNRPSKLQQTPTDGHRDHGYRT
jgi:NUMOD4 motif